MAHSALPVAAGLAAGIGFVVLFAMLTSNFPVLIPSTGSSGQMSVVVIPQGASLASSGKTFEPQTITVVIGLNNTVRWVNQDTGVGHWIEADNYDDPDFFNATLVLKPLSISESFEYTFTKPGEFGYHGRPHETGTVIVLEPVSPVAGVLADDSYDCGRIFLGGPEMDEPPEWKYNLLYEWALNIDGQRHAFHYEGEIANVTTNADRHSIEFDGRSAGSILQLRLPRTLIDSTQDGRDVPFIVLVNGQPSVNATQGIVPSTGDRMICIPFSYFSPVSHIEVVGTRVAPE